MKHPFSFPACCIKFLIVRKNIALAVFLFLPLIAPAQFEKKMSINLSGGLFKTFGTKDYPDPYYYDYRVPYIMPQFETGWLMKGGAQFNYNRKISFEANLGIARSGYWYYDAYDPDYDDYYCWLCWEIYDEWDEPVATGEDYLTLFNFSFGVAPKYYFLPAKKLNPYAFLELNLNYTTVDYIDVMYDAYVELGREDEYGESLSETMIEKSFGVGFYPGVGLEYTLNDNIGFFLQTGYWLILLNKKEFENEDANENFHAFKLHLGLRLSFLKAKEL